MTKGQAGLFDDAPRRVSDPESGERLRDAAIARVEEGADDEWFDEALARVERLAAALDRMTADDVWLTQLRQPRETRVMGAVFKEAAKRGWIEATSDWKVSSLPQCHRRPQRVWRGLL